MSEGERLKCLENLGEVPSDADNRDWHLAARTTWWGKPLDPGGFWKGRTVWLDDSATMTARRHGRSYPPIPDGHGSERFSMRSDEDFVAGGGAESGGYAVHFTDRESAFWDYFSKNFPKPPELIARKQVETESEILRFSSWPGATKDAVNQQKERIRTEPLALNYPPEAFSTNALVPSYILNENEQYHELLKAGDTSAAGIAFNNFKLPKNLIVDPVSPDIINTVNAWRIAYLQRLKQQNTGQPYIGAYLKTWNLKDSVLNP